MAEFWAIRYLATRQVLKDDIERKLSSLPNITEAEVEIVLDPPWDPSRLSEAARLQLGLI